MYAEGQGWVDDRDRYRGAGILDDLEFATSSAVAVEIVNKLVADQRCPPWVSGDEVYGRDANCGRPWKIPASGMR